MNCVPAAAKLSCSCYYWNGLNNRGWSPFWNKLKIGKPPLLNNSEKIQKPYQKWPTPKRSIDHSKNGQPLKPPETTSLVNYAGLRGTSQWLDKNNWNTATNSTKSLLGEKVDPLLKISEKSPAETPIRSSSTMDCVLYPSDCAVSISSSSTTNPNNETTHKMLKN